jgi:hypothetical protein
MGRRGCGPSPRGGPPREIIHDYNYAQVLTLDLLRKGMRMEEVPYPVPRQRARGVVRAVELSGEGAASHLARAAQPLTRAA